MGMGITCGTCEEKGLFSVGYSEGYDAYFCRICDTWLEEQCDEEDCDFCTGRPEKPSQVKSLQKDFHCEE